VPRFAYRAIAPDGARTNGRIEADNARDAVAHIRRLGVAPVEITEMAPATNDDHRAQPPIDSKAQRAVTKAIGELAVLLMASLPLDRALALTLENIDHAGIKGEFAKLLDEVKQGQPLSRAMARNAQVFPAMARAMAEAGEANGQLGQALERLAGALQQADDLRSLIRMAMIYPIILAVIAVSVILMMLLFVVPQFDTLFAQAGNKLPIESRFVIAASHGLRHYGLYYLGGGVLLGVLVRFWWRRPAARAAIDGLALRLFQIGALIRHIETARFSRTLGALIDGGVALPVALSVAQRTITNRVMARAIGEVAGAVKEGGGLTRPLAQTGMLPKLAIGFLRTGEEISQLGLMLGRLADVLDRDVKIRLQRLISLLTPAITVVLGTGVAAIIAAIMTAILGFNDVAVG
jgi:general secretion pathway protein F